MAVEVATNLNRALHEIRECGEAILDDVQLVGMVQDELKEMGISHHTTEILDDKYLITQMED